MTDRATSFVATTDESRAGCPDTSPALTTSASFALPFPDKLLWPNGRTRSFMAKHRVAKLHRGWAKVSLQGRLRAVKADPDSRVSLAVTVHPKTRHPIDRDNCVAALKSYIDGFADALGVNDRNFDTPEIAFGERVKGGLLAVTLTFARLSAKANES